MVERARDVALAPLAVEAVAERLATDELAPAPAWRTPPHWWRDDDPAATSQFVLLLDALNFSFWGSPRWRVRSYQGQLLDGYWALAASLRSAIERGVPLTDPTYLAQAACASELLRGDDGVAIPLLDARQHALGEVGQGVLDHCQGCFLACLERADWSAPAIVQLLASGFPSFRDVAEYDGQPVPFYKRAQLLVSDLHGALAGQPPIRQLETLTMFADYKVPQVLQQLGVLVYSPRLEAALRAGELMDYGDPREVEIRAGAVQAVEQLVGALAERGHAVMAYEIDWRLWSLGQQLDSASTLPYHRTRSVYY